MKPACWCLNHIRNWLSFNFVFWVWGRCMLCQVGTFERLQRLTHLIWKLLVKLLLWPSIKPSVRIVGALVWLTQRALRFWKPRPDLEKSFWNAGRNPSTQWSVLHICVVLFDTSVTYSLINVFWALARSWALCWVHRIWWRAATRYFTSWFFLNFYFLSVSSDSHVSSWGLGLRVLHYWVFSTDSSAWHIAEAQ